MFDYYLNIFNMALINKKNIKLAIRLQIINFIILFVFLTKSSNIFVNKLFHFGPNTSFLGININSWKKYYCIIFLLITFEAISTYSFKIYTNWYRNNIKDPKHNRIFFSKSETIFNISIWKTISWISKMLKMSILFSSEQIQFSLIQFVTRLIVSNIIDYKYIEPKIE